MTKVSRMIDIRVYILNCNCRTALRWLTIYEGDHPIHTLRIRQIFYERIRRIKAWTRQQRIYCGLYDHRAIYKRTLRVPVHLPWDASQEFIFQYSILGRLYTTVAWFYIERRVLTRMHDDFWQEITGYQCTSFSQLGWPDTKIDRRYLYT